MDERKNGGDENKERLVDRNRIEWKNKERNEYCGKEKREEQEQCI